jgi:hypothetical protein
MPLNITTGSLSAKGFGFTNLGLVKLTTGAEQEIFATSLGSRSAAIQLANGNIVTGSYIQSSNNQGLRYKALTVINSTAVYGSEQTINYNNCGGGSYNDTSLSSGSIVSGRQISHAEDGTNSYTGFGNLYYKTFDLTYKNTLSWSGASTTSVVQSGSWTDVPSTSVTNSPTVNICTGQAYFVGSGACGRLTYASINHFLYYRTLTVS